MTESQGVIPKPALSVVERLRAAGWQALLAGGCVRDLLLGREPKDFDVATNAPPSDVARVFPGSRLVGAKFGVVLVRRHGLDIEVATFRRDGRYSDGRRPDEVVFGTPEEDARRRDFTINGLFLDPTDNRVIDFVDGRDDLKRRLLRTIGNPDERFAEDHLRLLRAVRFAAALDFVLDPDTESAIRRSAASLERISPERVWMELERMMCAPTRAEAWGLIRRVGLADHLVVGWRPSDEKAGKIADRLRLVSTDSVSPALALACLWADEPAREIDGLVESLRLSNRLANACRWLAASLPSARDAERLSLADLKLLMASRDWPDLPLLLRAELASNGEPPDAHAALLARSARIDPQRVAPAPFLSGQDLMAMGWVQGPGMGGILRAVYRAQLDETVNSKEEALTLASKLATSRRGPL